MKRLLASVSWGCVLVAAVALLFVSAGSASTERILYSFSGKQDGGQPNCDLVMGDNGALYGTSQVGGNLNACRGAGCGAVFQLTHTTRGWKETVLFSFNGKDGDSPVSGAILQGADALYGTTAYGGADGKGVVFELKPDSNQTWKETLLHTFAGSQDGTTPFGDLLSDSDGNLYGTTRYGPGSGHETGYGTVFELQAANGWSEQQLYEFAGSPDGADPYAGLTSDAQGNFYGVTFNGGNSNSNCWQGSCGTVFMLSPQAGGGFTETLLHMFCSGSCSDGGNPKAGVIFDHKGNLYGTTVRNAGSKGTVFELSPNSDGTWTETVIYTFDGRHGDDPDGGLLFDQKGNLYGVTDVGGTGGNCPAGCGTAYKLTPKPAGGWTHSVLHYFGRKGDGTHPRRNLIIDEAGNLYGVTPAGGEYGQGIVFEITP
jgi:uncharacterized repeat protein (TIGR03803 family)